MLPKADIRAAVAAALVTLGIELGVYFLSRRFDAAPRESLLAALAACTVWVALATGALAAGGRTLLAALLRGGAVIDASGISLLVLWAAVPAGPDAPPLLSLLAVVKAYCVLAAMGLFSLAAVSLARRSTARQAAAVAAAAVLLVAAASPFWAGGLLRAANEDNRLALTLSAAIVDANPFYGVTAAVPQTGFVWHYWGIMYEQITPLGSYPPPPLRWYTSAVLLASLAAAMAVVVVFRTRKRK